MASKRPQTFPLTLLGSSIACSLVSLGLLIAQPHSTEKWRTSLNVVALLLVLVATGMIARAPREP